MGIRTVNPVGRWAFLIGVLLGATTLTVLAAKNWVAEEWALSSQPDNWLRATRLEPGNAEYWFRLGRYRQMDFEHSDLPLAITYYRRAVTIDSHSATYWMHLASAYEMVGYLAEAQKAFRAAELVYPISGEVAWRYGNFLLRHGDLSEGFFEIRRAIATNFQFAGAAVIGCLRVSGNIERVLDQAIPAHADVYLEALDSLVAEREIDAALAVWRRLAELHPSFEMRRAFTLLDALIGQDRIEEAQRVWQQALKFAGQRAGSSSGGSLVWDGGFEGNLVNGGFGWRQLPVAEASFQSDTGTFHSGSRSLRISFDGSSNLDFSHLVQYVPVKPGTRYRFAAYLRTEEISTDSGIRFWISDPHRTGAVDVLTQNLVGTHPWSLQETEVTTGPQTRLLAISLRRLPSRKFDNKLRGTVWIDDVSLTPVLQEVARPSL
jgi:tetratricopeptide (TPR) repeat protein